ncbi:MAG: hypothetical protein IT370_29760 [Deltaproteobacteria bacterium]|nr:hypothetical protein [Deltaproteobacteria bacterium]
MSSSKLRSRVLGVTLALAGLGITSVASAQNSPYAPPPGAAPAPVYPGYAPPPPGYAPAPAPYGAPAPAPYAAPAPAPAGYQPMYGEEQRPPGVERRGLIVGIGIGGGAISCDGCNDSLGGVSVDLHIGAMLGPRLGIMFDGYAIAHPIEGGGTFVHAVDTVAAQLFLGDRFWVKGGLGVGQLQLSDDSGQVRLESDTGPAVMLAAGFELLQTRTSALDIQVRAAATDFEGGTITNGSLNVAYNWY